MNILKKRRKSIILSLRNYFITGIVVLVPIGITLYLTKFFIQVSSKIIPNEINPNSYLPFAIPGIEILLSIILTGPETLTTKSQFNFLLFFVSKII